MFRKKKRLDSRIRFQHQEFTRKLDQARHYKRTAQALPEQPSYNVLRWLGLKSLFSQIAVIVIAAGVFYLIFIPNFLSARTIKVNGASGDDASNVRTAVQSYIDSSPFFKAQHNLLFLNKTQLSQALALDPKVYKVSKVSKSVFGRSIGVEVELKSSKYLVNQQDHLFAVYNDGSVKETLTADVSKWLDTPGLIKVKDDSNAAVDPGVKYFSPQLVSVLESLNERLKPESGLEVDYFGLPGETAAAPTSAPEVSTANGDIEAPPPVASTAGEIVKLPLDPINVNVYIKRQGSKQGDHNADIKLIFDTKQDLTKALQNLKLLLSQTASDRYNRLLYIDLRFPDRAFLCLINTTCAN